MRKFCWDSFWSSARALSTAMIASLMIVPPFTRAYAKTPNVSSRAPTAPTFPTASTNCGVTPPTSGVLPDGHDDVAMVALDGEPVPAVGDDPVVGPHEERL